VPLLGCAVFVVAQTVRCDMQLPERAGNPVSGSYVVAGLDEAEWVKEELTAMA